MNKYSLCIVVLHYNNAKMTCSYVKNLKKLKSTNYEMHIILVDNKSPDGSGEVLKETYKVDKWVDVVLLDKNLGFAKGNNAGIQLAREKYNADFIVVSNSDIKITDSEFFEKMLGIYEQTGFDIFGPDIYGVRYKEHQSPMAPRHLTIEQVDNKINHYKKTLKMIRLTGKLKLYYPLCRIKDALTSASGKDSAYGMDYSKPQEGVVVHGAFFVLTRKYMEAYPDGLYPETFLYEEEYILNYRAHLKNLKIVYDPSISVRHYEGVASLSVSGDRLNHLIFMEENIIKSCKVMKRYMLKTQAKGK